MAENNDTAKTGTTNSAGDRIDALIDKGETKAAKDRARKAEENIDDQLADEAFDASLQFSEAVEHLHSWPDQPLPNHLLSALVSWLNEKHEEQLGYLKMKGSTTPWFRVADRMVAQGIPINHAVKLVQDKKNIEGETNDLISSYRRHRRQRTDEEKSLEIAVKEILEGS